MSLKVISEDVIFLAFIFIYRLSHKINVIFNKNLIKELYK